MIERGDHVVVTEPGIPSWYGIVSTVKPGGALSLTAAWIEIRRDDGRTWVVPAELVSPDERDRLDSTTRLGSAMVRATRDARPAWDRRDG